MAMKTGSMMQDWNAPAALAGMTAFVWYAFGALPLHIAVSVQLGLSPQQTSSWVFIVWFVGALFSILLSFHYRQPIPITWTILIALGAGTVAALVGALPRGFVIVLAGVAILSAFQDALEKAFGGRLRFGALTAFAVAPTPFSVFGISSAFWAILAGLAGSGLAERKELLAYWRG